jgi:endonuclease YncB( thermonuclease family)
MPIAARLVKVVDGDTIKVKTDNETLSIRLQDIDAPERGCPFSRLCAAPSPNLRRSPTIIFGQLGGSYFVEQVRVTI